MKSLKHYLIISIPILVYRGIQIIESINHYREPIASLVLGVIHMPLVYACLYAPLLIYIILYNEKCYIHRYLAIRSYTFKSFYIRFMKNTFIDICYLLIMIQGTGLLLACILKVPIHKADLFIYLISSAYVLFFNIVVYFIYSLISLLVSQKFLAYIAVLLLVSWDTFAKYIDYAITHELYTSWLLMDYLFHSVNQFQFNQLLKNLIISCVIEFSIIYLVFYIVIWLKSVITFLKN